jgi:glycosyltransferase involved in cell wall biosynthesis
MKILELGKFYPPARGGIETLLKTFSEGFAQRGAKVRVIVANNSAHTVREKINGVQITRCASYGTAFSTSLSPMYLREAARDRADILHTHFPNPLADLAILRAPKTAKIVITYHSDIVRQAGLMSIYGAVLRRCLDRADEIIVATPRHLEFSTWLQPHKKKVAVIPFGIDPARLVRAATLPPSVPIAPRPILLTVGRLVGYKGHRFLIEAMKNLNATLWIVGEGPLESQLRGQVESSRVSDRVHFLGNVADEALPAFYQTCDIFVLPSISANEAFGMVQLEAMACAKPVISCDLKSGVPWVNQHEVTGLIVPPANPESLGGAINRLAKNPAEAQAFGAAGRQRVAAEFSEQRMIDDYFRLFEELVA